MASIQQITASNGVVAGKETNNTNINNSNTINNNTRMASREVEMRSESEAEIKNNDMEWDRIQSNKTNGWPQENISNQNQTAEENTSDVPEKDATGVIIFRSHKPVLKVELGTSLGVLKLLYEAESTRSGCQILGVRPKSKDGMPCIITLDESKLAEPQYDILISDKNESKPSANSINNNNNANPIEKTGTTRCIECSRESWKSKKFTSTGMNTEVSVNPSYEIDMRLFSSVNGNTPAKNYNHIVPSSPCNNYPTRGNRMRTNNGPQRQPMCPSVIDHNSTSVNNGVSNASAAALSNLAQSRIDMRNSSPPGGVLGGKGLVNNGEGNDIQRSINRSPSLPNDLYGSSHYPRESSLHAESNLFGNNMHRHASAFVDGRCRSPCSTSPPPPIQHRGDMPVQQRPSPVKDELNSDSNPTVYVLPNDYDISSGMEPPINEYHTHPHHPHHHHHHHHHHQHRNPIHHERSVVINGGDCQDEPDLNTPPTVVGYDLPTQVRIGDVSPTREGKPPRRSPARSNSVSPSSFVEEMGSPITQDSGTVPKLLCKICHKVFPTKSMLYKHLRGHSSDEKPYKCQECGQGFTLSSNLRQHRIIHRGYKPFQCEFCGKKFMRSNVYKQHRRIHTGEEMHKCNLCPSEFLQKYALMKHMKKQHDIDCGENM